MATPFLTDKVPPEKAALYGALGVYPDKNSALAELIDNSGEYGNTTNIRIQFSDRKIIISDNGAGLDAESMVSMFRIKRNEHAAGETGKFGYGFKSATAFLGRDTYVLGRRNGTFVWGKAEPNDEWQYEIAVIPAGDSDYQKYLDIWNEHKSCESTTGTIVFIENLKEEFSLNDSAMLATFIAETYSINFRAKGITTTINGVAVRYRHMFGKIYSKDFDKKKVSFGDIDFQVSIYGIDTDDKKSGITVVRNNRIIVSGYTFGIGGVTDPAMTNYQIVIWCDDRLDDYFKMTPMKTISPNQAIDRNFKRALIHNSGLGEEIKKIILSAPSAQEVFIPLSQHTRILNGLDTATDKLPATFRSYINDRETQLAHKAPKPTQAVVQPKVVQVVSRAKISTTPSIKVTTTSEKYTQGLFNIDLKPLGKHSFMWDVEERLINSKLQIVIVFNYDIPFIRGIISGPKNEVAKDLIREAMAQIIHARITRDKAIEATYKNTYRNIAKVKSILEE